MDDGEVTTLGRHRMRRFDTPHLPHAWECRFLLKERTATTLHRVWQYWLQARTIPAVAVSSASLVALRAVALASEVCWARSASASAMLTCKLFAGVHTPYGGLVLRVGAGLSFAPVGPRVMQGFHWEQGPW